MASYKAAFLVLSCAVLLESASGRQLQESSCNFDTVFSLRSEWESTDEPCHKKLPFELWTLMKAEGSAQSPDALHVRDNCIKTQESTTSEAGQAHEVAELITGLADLGCTRTMGEDQTVCVMSDSFDRLGFAEDLRASGDLPQVDVVKELPSDEDASDEGSAMLEIMFDIAPGATYKFNTATVGEQTFADDVTVLANEEMCDIIVDDIGYPDAPAFRDGVIAVAVDEAVDSGGLHFTSAGNTGNGFRFMSDFECATGFENYFEQTASCGTGVASHVFQPEETGALRYFYALPVETPEEVFYLHWDAEIGTTQDIWIALWLGNVATGALTFVFVFDEVSGEKAVEEFAFLPFFTIDGTVDANYRYYMQVIDLGEEGDIEAEFFLVSPLHSLAGSSDGAIYGHKCAANAFAIAAMDIDQGDGVGGAFEDPETSPVNDFSSRGPCIVNGETRLKPTTTAADHVTTSTLGFEEFSGTSAAAPAAGAIASIVRAACFPTVVGYAEITEMLTNYDYTIDLTSDAGGDAETWGAEGGYGIISASQMLAWIAANCGESCPGASTTEEPVAPSPEPIAPAPEPIAPSAEPIAPVTPETPTEGVLCNSFGCPGGFIPIPEASVTECGGGDCTVEQCCQAFCSFHACPDGYIQVPDAGTVECDGDGGDCTTEQCCVDGNTGGTGGGLLCNSFGCPGGYIPIPEASVTECDGGDCTVDQCCQAFCSFYACPDGYIQVPDAGTIECDGGDCSTEQCCVDNGP
ncbi:unnamed protein product [Pylaiella littoralis]